MIKLYTIGYAGKSAEEFFRLLKSSGAKKIIDIRLNNKSQLSGFAKGSDLKYFAKQIAGIDYQHVIDFAPSDVLLKRYRKKEMSWAEYEVEYLKLICSRDIAQKIDWDQLHLSCLLCSEHLPDHCHRRLLAEYLQRMNRNVVIKHLM